MITEATSVLLVDSDDSTSRTFKRILQKNNMTVSVAENKQEAINEINTKSFDAVIISLEFADIDGIDLLIFANKTVPNAAKLVAGGFPLLESGVKALESGADAVFSKPVDPELLVSIIKSIVKVHQT